MDENPKDRQENELLAIKSIYLEATKDLRYGTSNKWKPLDLIISLKAQEGCIKANEMYGSVDLHIKCPPQYPYQVPQIVLENGKGLSQLKFNELRSELVGIANKKVGEEMILELCQYVQDFLYEHNTPASKSFYQEMLERQQKEELLHKQAKEQEEDRQRHSVNEEINQIYSRLEEEGCKSRKKTNSETTIEGDDRRDSIPTDRRKDSSNDSSENSQCSHKAVESIYFDSNGARQILRGKCLKHSDYNRSVFCGIDKNTGEQFIINEYKIDIEASGAIHGNKQVLQIEQEFNKVTRKLKHQNLALYHSFSYNVDEAKYFIIQVLKEFVDGTTIHSLFTAPNISADMQYIKYIANGVLQALDYLHKKNVIHRDLKDSCIYINNKGIVKISNYNIHRRLIDLINNTHSTPYGKRTDIYKFGIFILGLLQGTTVSEYGDLKIPESVPPDLQDFLNKCLSKDEKERYTTSQLLSHQFLNQRPNVQFNVDEKFETILPEIDIPNDVLKTDKLVGSSNQSRISTEFEFIEDIGQGAFGDVKKYRNILDGRFYAIKRIQLNPKKKQLNKKIVREVQLLSRLNHENVVRYYNSWIETSEVTEEERPHSSETGTSYESKKVPIVTEHSELTMNDNIEELAPSINNAKVSITYDSKSQVNYEDSTSESDSSEDDEDNNDWGARYSKESESDGIAFEDSETSANELKKGSSQSVDYSSPENIIKIDYMYIQMEFCEKSTLKTAIDENLCNDVPRVQRLFREILEGLSHIHQQGMIHRDLKPVNIFLDREDHVKIGDFGLATTNLKSKLTEYAITKSAVESLRDDVVDESKTGHIGTPFYVAPELDVQAKAIYNEKVDIYSLGIILFEMCYKPPSTAMERCDILHKLRQKEIVFPEDYESTLVGKHAIIIRWLLNHDASKRPTSQELLQSEHVPPPILQEKALMDLIRHTLNNPQSKGYKYLVASCFDQTISDAQDITYDKDLSSTSLSKPLEIYYEFVKQITVKVFRKHGGQNLATPLLMPNNKRYTFYNKDCVRLMTHGGGIVSLPYDLRVSFARYIAWNHISLFRRYSIERVYREKKVFGFIPRELYECAFDIVTPSPGNLMSDGEILYIVFEIITQLPVLRDKSIFIQLNHTLLLKAILLYYGIKADDHNNFIAAFSEVKEGKSKIDLPTHLLSLGLSEAQASNLLSVLHAEYEPNKMATNFQMITKRTNTEYSKYAKLALQQLKTIIETAEAMGLTFEIVLTPGLMYNTQQFSGMICQFVCEFKKRKHNKMEVLAAGGRYDAMVDHYRTMQKGNILSKDTSQSAVGISISLDKLVQAIQKEQTVEGDSSGHFDVMICSVGNKRCLTEKMRLLSSLSTAGVRCALLDAGSNKEVEEHREELKVPYVVILKDSEEEKVILRNWEKDRFQEKTYSIPELIDDLPKSVKRLTLLNSNQDTVLTRSDSKSYVEKSQTGDPVTIVFHTSSDKIASNARRRYEIQISSQLNEVFKRLLGNVIVLALNNIDVSIIKTLAVFLEFQTYENFQKSVDTVIEKHPRHRKILNELCDVIYEHKCKPSKPFLILYSLTDSGYKLIV